VKDRLGTLLLEHISFLKEKTIAQVFGLTLEHALITISKGTFDARFTSLAAAQITYIDSIHGPNHGFKHLHSLHL
jgi:hypothetical protein